MSSRNWGLPTEPSPWHVHCGRQVTCMKWFKQEECFVQVCDGITIVTPKHG